MRVMRKIIEIDDELCNGCGQCVPSCAEGALEIVDGKARMLAEKYCDGLGACLGECPQGALRIIEREAEDFDEQAVEAMLSARKAQPQENTASACGCPSSQVQDFQTSAPAARAKQFISQPAGPTNSALTHWPVQIRLVPPNAPFLQGADLLIAADCTAFAYPDFHKDLLAGKVLMVGCPKFDEAEAYVQKFAEIFKTANPNSLTLAIMEVPCCGAMRMIAKEALKRSGLTMEGEVVVIGARGHLIRKEAL